MSWKGVDISEFNGDVDFAALKSAGIQFVIIRCGYGSDYTNQDDKYFSTNVDKAEAAGIPWGTYLYSYATTKAMALSEAAHVRRLLNGRVPKYGVWYDVEDAQIADADLTTTCSAFCDSLEADNLYVGIYASLSWMNYKLTKLTAYDKWVAQWNDECTYKGSFGLWQYTDKLSIGNKAFDGNIAYYDYPATVAKMTGSQVSDDSVNDGDISTKPDVDDTVDDGNSGDEEDKGWGVDDGSLNTSDPEPTPHVHDWSDNWTFDSSHHWHECSASGCDITDNSKKSGFGPHVFTDDNDTTCNVCGYVREIESGDDISEEEVIKLVDAAISKYFTDLAKKPASSWATSALYAVITYGIMSGDGGNLASMRPLSYTQRQELAQMVYKGLHLNSKVSSWAKTAWNKAKKEKLMDGTRPGEPLTNEECAVVLNKLNLL